MKRLTLYFQFAILLACTAFSQSAFADVKIKTRQTMQGQSYENTTYIKGKRQRSERNMGAMSMIDILMCDLKQNVQIMPQSRSYFIDLWSNTEAPTTQNAANKNNGTRVPQPVTEKGGVVTMTYTNKDTGERKQMFGYTARHIITTIETESSPDACSPMKSKMITDGWYIDAAFQLDCDTDHWKNYRPAPSVNGGCRDRYETKTIGTARLGYPVYQKTTMFDTDGKESYSMINEVVEISNAVLEDSLFNVPAGYTQAKTQQELYVSAYSTNSGKSAMNDGDDTPSNSGASNPVKNLPPSNTKVAATLGAKKPGVARIGLAAVKTGAVGDGINATQLASAIGATLADNLKVPNVELVQINAASPAQIESEAKQKECDFIVYTNVSHKKGGGGFGGMFGKAAGNILGSTIPMAGGTGAAIAGQVVGTTVYTAAVMSESIKSKDEITLEITMNKAGGAVLTKQYKAKAKSDREDIITPMIRQAAQEIINAASAK